MWTITSRDELDKFSNQRALISLFVDHAYSERNIVPILGMREGFDKHVGSAWHMLIPYRNGGYAVDDELSPKLFGVGLSRQIINEHGLKHSELPAIIFEFVPQQEHYCVKLGGMREDEILNIIGNIADIASDEFEHGPRDVGEFRERVHNRVLIFLRQRKVLSILSKSAPKIAAVIGLSSDVVDIFKSDH